MISNVLDVPSVLTSAIEASDSGLENSQGSLDSKRYTQAGVIQTLAVEAGRCLGHGERCLTISNLPRLQEPL